MEMPKRLLGKVAVVTASSQGIGYGIALRLGQEGASVVISSRKKKNVDEAVKSLREAGIVAFGVVCHVSNAEHRRNLFNTTVTEYGKIDILVSNAAANPTTDSIMDSSESILDKLWEVNVKSGILLAQEAAKHMRKGSSIVFVTSIAGYRPVLAMNMYSVTKTTLLGLTKALASELGPDIRVNGLAPGFVHTRFADAIVGMPGQKEKIERDTPLKRLGTIEDMGAAIAFLVSDDAAYITGETLVVAGGLPSRL